MTYEIENTTRIWNGGANMKIKAIEKENCTNHCVEHKD